MVVSHNIGAINAQRQLGGTEKKRGKAAEKLSSGYRINRAGDDAAGLAISEKMRKQVKGLDRASTNAQDGISMVQIADGAMAEVNDMLNRCVELAVHAANGTLSLSDRQAIQNEVDQIKTEIDGISDRTKFNEIKVLQSDATAVNVYKAGDDVVYHGGLPECVSVQEIDNGTNYMSSTWETTETVLLNYTDAAGMPQNLTGTATVTHAAAFVDFSKFHGDPDQIADLIGKGLYFTCCTCDNHYSIEFADSDTNTMERSGNHYIYKVGVRGAKTAEDLINRILEATKNSSNKPGNPQNHYTKLMRDGDRLVVYDDRRLRDHGVDTGFKNWESALPAGVDPATVDVRAENFSNANSVVVPNPWSKQGIIGPGVARANQVYDHTEYANFRDQVALQIGADTGNQMIIKLPAISTKILGISDISLLTEDKATNAIDIFKEAGNYVSAERSRMGAYQNGLEHTIKNLDNTVENTTAAESRIRDTDMAEMTMEYLKDNILSQSGQAMLAQANSNTESVLTFLR